MVFEGESQQPLPRIMAEAVIKLGEKFAGDLFSLIMRDDREFTLAREYVVQLQTTVEALVGLAENYVKITAKLDKSPIEIENPKSEPGE